MDGSTIFYTVLSGTLVFVIGQIIQKFFIDPIHDQKKIIGDIADNLIFYAQIYANPAKETSDKYNEASKKIRELSSKLSSKTYLIPAYKYLTLFKVVKDINKIKEASRSLICISNRVYENGATKDGINLGIKNSEEADKISELLNIKI